MKRILDVAPLLSPALLCFAAAVTSGFSAQRSTRQAANGKRIFNQYCSGCHDTLGDTAESAPVLRGYYHRQPRPSDPIVQRIIERGKGGMPPFSTLSSSQVDDLVAYLKTL